MRNQQFDEPQAEPKIKTSLVESLKASGKGNVPAPINDNGEGGRELVDGSVTAVWREQVRGERLRFNKDSGEWWVDSGGNAPKKAYLTSVAEFLQRRQGGKVVEIIVRRAGEEFPDVRDLNKG